MLSFYSEFPNEPAVKSLLKGDELEFLFVLTEVPARGARDNLLGEDSVSVKLEHVDGLVVRTLPDGAVHTGEIKIAYPHMYRTKNGKVSLDPGEMADLKPFTVYRAKGALSPFSKYRAQGTALLFSVWDVISLQSDPELEDIATGAAKNGVINTKLGQLTIQRGFVGSFEGHAKSLGVNVSIPYEDPDPLSQGLTQHEERFASAVHVLNRVITRKFLKDARKFAATEALPRANEWRHDVAEAEGRRTPAREWRVRDVARRFRPTSVIVPEKGEILIEFDDGDLFGGHPVTVVADRDGTLLEVELD